MKSPKPDHFCVIPFVHFSCKPDGRARVCCFSKESYVLNKDGQPSYLGKTPINEIWNSEWMNSFRQRTLGPTPLKECQHCYTEEAAGKQSKRLRETKKYEARAAEAVAYAMENEGRIEPFRPIYFDLRLGNLCNLKCRSCNPLFSSAWAREVENNPESKAHQKYQDLLNESYRSESWYKNPDFWEQFKEIADTVEEIYLTGGEPMLIKEHFTLLKYFVEQGHAAKIQLRYNTNVTLLPSEFLALAPEFKEVVLSCSIDALEEKNDWLRFPSKWKVISTNFDRILQLPANVRVDINCTVSVFNILYFDELVRHFKKISQISGRKFEVSADILHEPHFMRLELLPLEQKKLAQERLRALEMKVTNLTDLETRTLKALIKMLDKIDADEKNQLKELSLHINSLDKIRNENFNLIFPEISMLGAENKI